LAKQGVREVWELTDSSEMFITIIIIIMIMIMIMTMTMTMNWDPDWEVY